MENGTNVRRKDGHKYFDHARGKDGLRGEESDAKEGQGAHKRSRSGSLLGSIPFLRSSTKDVAKHESTTEVGEDTKRSSSLAAAIHQGQSRKRKGSLRKAAMFGTGKLMRERRNSVRASKQTAIHAVAMSSTSPDEETTPRRFSYESESLNSSSDSGWPPSGKLSIVTTSNSPVSSANAPNPRMLPSPLTSPIEGPYASTTTTDDDDGVTFYRVTTSSSGPSHKSLQVQPPGASSSLQRRRSHRGAPISSLTIVHTAADTELGDEEWDYSETEWWGWVVLIVTWLVFVVGMGSCLGVWSWAWDVGETPYAPPELEDDPTLPITGYYPALMVCTAVMAWVWVVFAWVGMKYFRHAKMVGEDG